ETYLGYQGIGRLTISNSTVQAGNVNVGSYTNSTVTVVGSTITMTGVLGAGLNTGGNGAVWLTDSRLIITNSPGNTQMTIGGNGTGALTLSNSTVLVASARLGGFQSGGTLTIAGGTLELSGIGSSLTINGFPGAISTALLSGGRLVVTNGTTSLGGQ